jgi:hypothetical protein
MNQEEKLITDPIEKSVKFSEIQQDVECLNALYETNEASKKEL